MTAPPYPDPCHRDHIDQPTSNCDHKISLADAAATQHVVVGNRHQRQPGTILAHSRSPEPQPVGARLPWTTICSDPDSSGTGQQSANTAAIWLGTTTHCSSSHTDHYIQLSYVPTAARHNPRLSPRRPWLGTTAYSASQSMNHSIQWYSQGNGPNQLA